MRLDPSPSRTSKAPHTAPLSGVPRLSAPATVPLTTSLPGTPRPPATAPLPKLGTDALALTGQAGPSMGLADVVARAKAAAMLPKPEWTMAVNLTTTLSGKFGAEPKAQQLKDLARETEGKPVTLVAQQVTVGETGSIVERFVIKDGKVTPQGSRPSEGFAKDLESLTSWAAKDHPASRMGVIIQSHGNSIEGMWGDNGKASLKEISSALSRGLQQGGRPKLDILDFDACLMGQHEVVAAMNGISDHVLASSEVELANDMMLGGTIDGQPMQEMLRALLMNPEMDAEAFASKTIGLASQAARPFDANRDGVADPGSSRLNATPTLAHYDMDQAGPMAAAMDALGTALSGAMKDPASRRAIEDVIARSPRFSPGRDLEAVGRHQRDLKGFSEGLQVAIAFGKLKDPSDTIQDALTDATKALDGLVGSHFGMQDLDLPGSIPQDYSKMGGLGVFLPSAEFVRGTPETLASPLERIGDHAKNFADQLAGINGAPPLPEDMISTAVDFFVNGLRQQMGMVRSVLSEDYPTELQPLVDAYLEVVNAEPDALGPAVRKLEAAATQAQSSGLGQVAQDRIRQNREARVDEAYSLAQPHMEKGWQQFTQSLRTGE